MYTERRIWNWLQWIGYTEEVLDSHDPSEEVVLLRSQFVDRLYKGTEFKEILERLSIYYEIPFSKQQILTNITAGETGSQKRHNWELILDFLAQIGFRVGSNIAQELQNPNENVMRSFLADLMEFLPERNKPEEDYSQENRTGAVSPDRRNGGVIGDVTFNDQFLDSHGGGKTTSVNLGREQTLVRGKKEPKDR